mgnify:CR=1 FL=1
MNKFFFFVFVFFLNTPMTKVLGQKHGDVSLSFGPAFTVGKFASTDLSNNASGFANLGTSLSLSYFYPLSKNWKFIVNASGQRNPINTNAFETIFSTAKIYQGFTIGSDPFNPPSQTNYAIYPNWHFDKKSWLMGAFQIGVFKQFIISGQNKISPTIRTTIGAAFVSSPLLKGSCVTDTASAYIEQSKSSGLGLIFSIGGGIKYSMTKRIALLTNMEYCRTSDIQLKDIKTTLTTTNGIAGSANYAIQQTSSTKNGDQIISSLNLSFGISIAL